MKQIFRYGMAWLRQRLSQPKTTAAIENYHHWWSAWQSLIGRYVEHFSFFWQRRHQISLPNLKPHEAEFLPSALAIQAAPAAPLGRWLVRILVGLVLSLLLWSILGQIDIVVNASGKIIPSDRTKTMASVETARIDKLLVAEGQNVHAGDVLIELDTRMSDRERDKALGDQHIARLQVARSRALLTAIATGKLVSLTALDGIPSDQIADANHHLLSQWMDFEAKRRRLDGEVDKYSRQLPLATQRANDYMELAQAHDVSTHAWLEKEQDKVELEGRLAEAKNQREALIAETRKTAEDALNDGQKIASAATQDAERARAHSDLLELKSPVDGTVQQLTVHTVGGVVAAAQPLMVIVPNQNQVEIEAYIDNKDIGFVQEGQPVTVKIEAFDYTKYGTVPGVVSHVSHDAIDPSGGGPDTAVKGGHNNKDDKPSHPSYAIKVVLKRGTLDIDGRQVALTPGMSATVDIKTGRRRIIEYFLSPLIRHTRESMNER